MPPTTGGVSIAIPIDMPFSDITKILEAQFAGKTFPEDGSGPVGDSGFRICRIHRRIFQALNIDQTPTLFVNGRRIGGSFDWTSLKSIIDFEIEYQKTAKNAGEDCGCELKLDLPVPQQKKILPMTPVKK